jgi:hypothetical protein
MGKIFVEYAISPDDPNYKARPLNCYVKGRGTLDFEPKEEYDGRRVESFDTEAQAERFIHSKSKLFKYAREIMDVETQDKISRIVDLRLKQIFVRLEALEDKGAEAPVAPKRRTRAKKVE